MTKSEQAPSSLLAAVKQYRFAALMVSMLLMFFYDPFVHMFALGTRPFVARVTLLTLFTTQLVASVITISKNKKTLRVAILLVSPVIILEFVDVWVNGTATYMISYALLAAFLTYVIVVLLRFIFQGLHVTADTIFASLCVYLLMGVLWAIGYSLLQTVQPNSFAYSLAEEPGEAIMRLGRGSDGLAFYYSFVTMTTLGYGDIVPVNPAARAMTTMQAVVGQLYLTVLVARLVGLHVAGATREERRGK